MNSDEATSVACEPPRSYLASGMLGVLIDTVIGLSFIALAAMVSSSHAWAQVPSIEGVKCSIGGRPVPCDDGPSGGGGVGGGHRGPDVLDALIDNIIGPLFGYSSPGEIARYQQAKDLSEEGRRLSGQGDRRGALVKYREALARYPSSRATRFNIANNEAVLAYETGDLPLAIAKAREAIPYTDNPAFREWLKGLEEELADKISWQEANYYHKRGRKLFDEGKYADAEAAFREAMRLRPNDWAFPYNLGFALEYQNRVADAEAAYQRAVALNPKDSDGHFRLALMRIYLGRYAEAEKAYRAAAQIAPSQSGTRVGLGYALEKQGHRAEAEAQYREAIRLAPENYWGHLRLGDLLRTSKKYADAEAPYREAVRLEPKNTDARFGLAYTLIEKGKRDEAEAQYREVIRLNPKSDGALFNLAKSLLTHNRAREAEGLLREVIELSPRDVEGYNSLGVALEKQGRYQEAQAAYGKALEIDPKYKLAQENLKTIRGDIESKANSIWSAVFPGEKASGGSLQPFPSGNADVSPGTSASSAPAIGRSGGGTAMEQAKGASEYGKSAKGSDLSGGAVQSEEPGSDKARIVFETPGQGGTGAGGVVDVSNIGIRRTIPPELLARNPELRKLHARQEANEAEGKRLRDQLDEVRVEKGKPGADRGSLDMREMEIKDRLSKNEYGAGLIRREIDQKIETARAGAQPEQKSETQYISLTVEFNEGPLPKQQPAGPPGQRKP